MSIDKTAISGDALPGLFASAFEYLVDTGQRSVLFLDVMRQRGLQYREHIAETAPHVLNYEVELILDGRTLQRPVNYALVSVAPPSGVEIDNKRRPFVVVDPRAGHGPGIGGFKADSEIGVAMKAGHPCYFVGFMPDPMPGQTIGDIARAEALFGRSARRELADGARQRYGGRQVRRWLAGAELREPEPGQYAVDQAVQRLLQGRHRGTPIP